MNTTMDKAEMQKFASSIEQGFNERYESLLEQARKLGEIDGIKCRALFLMAAEDTALMGDEINKKIKKARKEYEYYL